jgi:hypothetical protein
VFLLFFMTCSWQWWCFIKRIFPKHFIHCFIVEFRILVIMVRCSSIMCLMSSSKLMCYRTMILKHQSLILLIHFDFAKHERASCVLIIFILQIISTCDLCSKILDFILCYFI